jgi:zinc protease
VNAAPAFDAGRVPPPEAPPRRILLLDRPGAPQSELRIGHPGVARRSPDYHPLLVMNTLLGGHFVSRINLNLRERKGYTYGARTAFEFRRGAGPFLFQASVQTSATADAIRETLDELDAVRGRRPATAGEIDTARAALTRGFPRSFETTTQIARAIAQLVVYELPADAYEQFVPRVNEVGPELATEVAHRHLDPGRMLVVVVGDRGAIEASLRDLHIGDVQNVNLD